MHEVKLVTGRNIIIHLKEEANTYMITYNQISKYTLRKKVSIREYIEYINNSNFKLGYATISDVGVIMYAKFPDTLNFDYVYSFKTRHYYYLDSKTKI